MRKLIFLISMFLATNSYAETVSFHSIGKGSGYVGDTFFFEKIIDLDLSYNYDTSHLFNGGYYLDTLFIKVEIPGVYSYVGDTILGTITGTVKLDPLTFHTIIVPGQPSLGFIDMGFEEHVSMLPHTLGGTGTFHVRSFGAGVGLRIPIGDVSGSFAAPEPASIIMMIIGIFFIAWRIK